MVWGPLLAAGASLLSGYLSKKSAEKQHNQNVAATNSFNAEQRARDDAVLAEQKRQFQVQYDLNNKQFDFNSKFALSQDQFLRDQHNYAKSQDERNYAFSREQFEYGKQLNEQANDTSGNLARLKKAALDNGINPLTLLRAGGASSVATSQAFSPANYSPISATVGSTSAALGGSGVSPTVTGGGGGMSPPPLLSSPQTLDVLGGGVNTFFSALAQAPDPEREHLEKQLMREELRSLQGNSPSAILDRNFGYTIPHVVSTSGVDHASSRSIGQSDFGNSQGSGYTSGNVVSDLHESPLTSYVAFGKRVTPSPDFSDHQLIVQRSGEGVADKIGYFIAASDWHNTLIKKNKHYNHFWDGYDLVMPYFVGDRSARERLASRYKLPKLFDRSRSNGISVPDYFSP